jgi:chromosomal replication initiator protein
MRPLKNKFSTMSDPLLGAGEAAGADLWRRGCERFAAELPEQQFNTWIRPLPPATLADAAVAPDQLLVVQLRVPNHFKRDWIRRQYAPRLEEILSELAGRPARLELVLATPSRDAFQTKKSQ